MRNYIIAVLVIAMLLVGFGSAFELKAAQTETSTFTTTTTIGGVELLGKCTVVYYVQADSLVYTNTTLTLRSGNTTTYFTESTPSFDTPYATATSTYNVTLYANQSTKFSFANTELTPTSGAGLWNVTTCNFGPAKGS